MRNKVVNKLLIIAVLVSLGAGCANQDRVDAVLKKEGDTAKGEVLFEDDCATCHGSDGQGTNAGPDLTGSKPDEDTQKDWVGTILDGGGDMPAFGDEYSDQEVANVLAWLEKLAD